MTCAQAGDSINDANFTKETANAAILQLSTLEMFMVKSLEQINTYRKKDQVCEEAAYFDEIFENEIEEHIASVKESYDQMIYRDVVKHGLHEFVGMSNYYLINCGTHKPRRDLIERYIFLQLLFLYPICPHFCEVAYIDYFLGLTEDPKAYPALLGECRKFPEPKAEINHGAIRAHQYFIKFMVNARDAKKKVSKPKKGGEAPKFEKATIIYRSKFQEYQLEVLKMLNSSIEPNGEIKEKWREDVKIEAPEEKKRALMFGSFVVSEYKTMGKNALAEIMPFDEHKTLDRFMPIIKEELKMNIQVTNIDI